MPSLPERIRETIKIVIVADSAEDSNRCQTILHKVYGDRLQFTTAENAMVGFDTCNEARPDCVLVDYMLPDMTGAEFVETLVESLPGTAVVMLTGLDSGEVAAAAMRAGANDFLLKDRLTGETLQLAIEKSIQRLNLVHMLKLERDRLADSLAEKEALLREVHHRVRNNLQVIVSLLRMQSKTHQDQLTARELRKSQHRVESMAMIHEQLYQDKNFNEIDLERHVLTLVKNLFEANEIDPARISYEIKVDCASLPVDQAIPVGLILNEVISNVLKHAFPDGRSGTIRINCHCLADRLDLTVEDDGAGMPESVNLTAPETLGMEIVKILTLQLKGTSSWTRVEAPGSGTTFCVSFPELSRIDGTRKDPAMEKEHRAALAACEQSKAS
jgi:two-component sensor histidine kinase/CheY-like chemotaxis protein